MSIHLPEIGEDVSKAAHGFNARADELAALNRKIGRGRALLEVQDWAKANRDALKRAGLYESLLRLTVPQ